MAKVFLVLFMKITRRFYWRLL